MADGTGPGRRFEELVQCCGRRAYQFAYRLCGNVDEACDLVQESFSRILENWESVDPGRSPESLYFRVLRNAFVDARRREGRRPVVPLDAPLEGGDGTESYLDVLPDGGESVLDGLERRERDAAVRAAFARLSVDHRAALLLADIERRSYEDIAETLDIPPGTVRSRVARARLALRRALAARLEVNP